MCSCGTKTPHRVFGCHFEPPRPAGLPRPVCSRGSHTEPSAARRARRGFEAQDVVSDRRRLLHEPAPDCLFHRQCLRAMEVTKPKGGRPRKSAAMLRSRTVRFRVSEAEYLRVQRKAKACNLTLSEYARQAVVSGRILRRIGTEELRLVSEHAREEQLEPTGFPPARLRCRLPRRGAAANPPLLRRGDRTAETKTLKR